MNRNQAKAEIMQTLAGMDPVAADAAKYLADRLLEFQGHELTREAMAAYVYDSMSRAIRDSYNGEHGSHAEVIGLAMSHGQEIVAMAIAMASFVASQSRKGWLLGAVAAGLGIAVAAMIG